MDIGSEKQFQKALGQMSDQLASGYPVDSLFEKVLSGIKEFRKDAIVALKPYFGMGQNGFLKELDLLLNPMFNSGQEKMEAIEKLAKDDCHCFLLKKSYQISHASGWIKHHPPQSEIIESYLKLKIFADHLETLNQRLRHILETYHDTNSSLAYGGYKGMREKVKQASLNSLNIEVQAAWIRNAINHGASLCCPSGIEVLKPSCNVSHHDWEKLRKLMTPIVQYSILLATEIDYRLFKYSKGNPELKPAFQKLFDLYKESYFLGQNLK